MKPLQVQDDIIPIGEFKAHASSIMRRLQKDRRPIVITQRGRPAGVLVSPEDYDRLTERDRFLAAVNQGLAESEAGLGIDDDDLDAELEHRFGPLDEP